MLAKTPKTVIDELMCAVYKARLCIQLFSICSDFNV